MLSACPALPASARGDSPESEREISPSSSAAFLTLSRSDWSSFDDDDDASPESNLATLPPCLSGNGKGRSFSSGSAT